MPVSLTEDQWQPIDEFIFSNNKLKAFHLIRAASGASLSEALELFVGRFEKLRADRKGEFTADLEGYWEGFYS